MPKDHTVEQTHRPPILADRETKKKCAHSRRERQDTSKLCEEKYESEKKKKHYKKWYCFKSPNASGQRIVYYWWKQLEWTCYLFIIGRVNEIERSWDGHGQKKTKISHMNEGHHYSLSIWHGLSIFERFNDTFFFNLKFTTQILAMIKIEFVSSWIEPESNIKMILHVFSPERSGYLVLFQLFFFHSDFVFSRFFEIDQIFYPFLTLSI